LNLGKLGLVALLLQALSLGPALAAPAVDYDDVAVEQREGVYHGNFSLQIAVPPAVALEVLTDFEHMAEFVPNLSASHVISRAGNVYRIAQQGKAHFGPFGFAFESERQIEVLPDGRILSKALSGSTKYMRSEMRLQASGGGTRLDYRIEMIPDRWAPALFGVGFLRHELAEQFSALVNEMQRRQASRPIH